MCLKKASDDKKPLYKLLALDEIKMFWQCCNTDSCFYHICLNAWWISTILWIFDIALWWLFSHRSVAPGLKNLNVQPRSSVAPILKKFRWTIFQTGSYRPEATPVYLVQVSRSLSMSYFSYFHLLKSHSPILNQFWHRTSLGKVLSNVFKLKAMQAPF